MADVDGAGVLPLELDVGLCDCSLVLSWVEDMVASLEKRGGGRLSKGGSRLGIPQPFAVLAVALPKLK